MRTLRCIVLGAFGFALSCRGGGPEPKLDLSAKAPGATSPSAGDGGAAASSEVPVLRVVLDDARLARAKERQASKDFSGAALAIDDARRGPPPAALGKAEACAWDYVSARLHLAANELAAAAEGFDRVTALVDGRLGECPLASYAAVRASQAYARMGRWDEALARARVAPDNPAYKEETQLTLADALAGKGDRANAARIWRELLTSNTRSWLEVSLKLANALLDGAEGDPSAHAAEALRLATRAVVESPKNAGSDGADLARARAIQVAKDPSIEALGDADRARMARAWLDAGDVARALGVANAVLAAEAKAPDGTAATQSGPRVKDATIACNAGTTRAQATAKMKGTTASGAMADAWGDAIALCQLDGTSARGSEAYVAALYSGGKASFDSKRYDEATLRFAKVEQLFPAHRLADDARFKAALVARDAGDEARFASMLLALPDDYPSGDMRGEALFRVALLRMTKGDWSSAKPILERILALFPNDRHWATAGRAAYFRARAAAMTGDADDAKKRYVEVVLADPLAFYMTQAYARLADADPALARRTLDDAVAGEVDGPLVTRGHPELAELGFQRGLRLLEVGEIEAARREIAASGATADGVDPEVLWTLGLLYNRAGAPELGHAVARGRLTEHLAHYPAGRWRAMWEVAFPRAFELLVARESAAHGIPAALTWAIMREESDFYPEAKSSANAYGLMQLIVPTAKGVAAGTSLGWNEDALKRPEVNVALGTKLLSGLRASFSVNPSLAVAAYNGGGGAVGNWVGARSSEDFDMWVEEIPWDETRGYIKRVLASEAAYAFLYERSTLDDVLRIPTSVSHARTLDAGASD